MGAYILVATLYVWSGAFQVEQERIEQPQADRAACYAAKARFQAKANEAGKFYLVTCRERRAYEARPASWRQI